MALGEFIATYLGRLALDNLLKLWTLTESPDNYYQAALEAARKNFHRKYGDMYGKRYCTFFDFKDIEESIFRACFGVGDFDIAKLSAQGSQKGKTTPTSAISDYVEWLRRELSKVPQFAILLQHREQFARIEQIQEQTGEILTRTSKYHEVSEGVVSILKGTEEDRRDRDEQFKELKQLVTKSVTPPIGSEVMASDVIPKGESATPILSPHVRQTVYITGLENTLASLSGAVRASVGAIVKASEELVRLGRISEASLIILDAAEQSSLALEGRYQLLCAGANTLLMEPFEPARVEEAASVLRKIEHDFPNGNRNAVLRALLHLAKEEFERAYETVSQVPTQSEYYGQAVNYAVAALVPLGRVAEALGWIQRVPKEKRDAKYFHIRAQLHANAGDFESALVDASEAITRNPEAIHTYVLRGRLIAGDVLERAHLSAVFDKSQLDKLKTAHKDFATAVGLFEKRKYSPWSSEAVSYLGITTCILYGPEKALDTYRRAETHGVLLASQGLRNRAMVYAAAGDVRSAVEDLKRARQTARDPDQLDKTLCATLVLAGDFQESRHLFETHPEWATDPKMACLKAQSFHPHDVRRQLEEIKGFDEEVLNRPETQVALFSLYLELVDLGNAEQALRQAVRSEDEPALKRGFEIDLAHFLIHERNQVELGLQIYERYYAPSQNARFLGRYVSALLREGKFLKVKEIEDELIRNNPDDIRLLDMTGAFHIKFKDYKKGEQRYRRLVELRQNDARYHHSLAICLEGLGRLAEAITEVQRAISQDRNQADYHYHLSTLFYRVEKPRDAIVSAYNALGMDPTNPQYYVNYFAVFGAHEEQIKRDRDDDLIKKFREVAEQYSSRFPEHGAIRSITGSPDELREQVKKMVVEAASYGEGILAQYREKYIPLYTLARLLGKEEYETWASLPAIGASFKYWGENDLDDQLAALGKTDVLLLHSSSLFFLASYDRLSVLLKADKRLFYSQALLNELQETLSRLILQRQASGVVRAVEAEPCLIEVGRDAWQVHIDVVKRLMTFLQQHCRPLPNPVEFSTTPEKMIEVLGEEAACLFITARKRAVPILCDDYVTRMLGKNDFSALYCTATALIILLTNSRKITPEVAFSVTLDLIRHKYNFVPLTPEFAYWAGARARPPEVEEVLAHLLGQPVGEVAVMLCLGQLLRGICERTEEPVQVASLLDASVSRVLGISDRRVAATVLVFALRATIEHSTPRKALMDSLRRSGNLPGDTIRLGARIVRELVITLSKGFFPVQPQVLQEFLEEIEPDELPPSER